MKVQDERIIYFSLILTHLAGNQGFARGFGSEAYFPFILSLNTGSGANRPKGNRLSGQLALQSILAHTMMMGYRHVKGMPQGHNLHYLAIKVLEAVLQGKAEKQISH